MSTPVHSRLPGCFHVSALTLQVAVQHDPELLLGEMRCMHDLGEWDELINLSNKVRGRSRIKCPCIRGRGM